MKGKARFLFTKQFFGESFPLPQRKREKREGGRDDEKGGERRGKRGKEREENIEFRERFQL